MSRGDFGARVTYCVACSLPRPAGDERCAACGFATWAPAAARFVPPPEPPRTTGWTRVYALNADGSRELVAVVASPLPASIEKALAELVRCPYPFAACTCGSRDELEELRDDVRRGRVSDRAAAARLAAMHRAR